MDCKKHVGNFIKFIKFIKFTIKFNQVAVQPEWRAKPTTGS